MLRGARRLRPLRGVLGWGLPLVLQQKMRQFYQPFHYLVYPYDLKCAANQRRRLVVLDIPLLFETGGEVNCHAVAVVSAPQYLQKIRVMARRGMTEEKFQGILARQIDDMEKRRRADFVIPTGLGKRRSLHSIKSIIKIVKGIPSPNLLYNSKAGPAWN